MLNIQICLITAVVFIGRVWTVKRPITSSSNVNAAVVSTTKLIRYTFARWRHRRVILKRTDSKHKLSCMPHTLNINESIQIVSTVKNSNKNIVFSFVTSHIMLLLCEVKYN